MKILLINTYGGFEFLIQNIKRKAPLNLPPLGLLYVARSLQDNGHTVEVIELFGEKDYKKTILQSLKSSDVVGLSVSSYPFYTAEEIAILIKKHEPSIPIIIGGPHPSFHPKDSLFDVPHADISVSGDAEVTVKLLVEALKNNRSLSSIPGIHYRKKNRIYSGKQPVKISNIDGIAFPSRELVDKYQNGYYTHKFSWCKPMLASIITSRGCPYHCSFCARNDFLTHFRERSPKNVIYEFEEINKKYKSVVIVDENFLTSKKRAHKILDGIIEMKLDLEIVILGTRVDSVEKELLKKLKKAGVNMISFGLESGKQKILDFYHKQISIEQIRKAITLTNKFGIFAYGNFILGAPCETKSDINATIKFAQSLPLDIVDFHRLHYLFGSNLWEEMYQKGKIKENEYSVPADIRRGLSNFSIEELTNFCNDALRKYYLRPQYIFRELIKSMKQKDFRLIKSWLYYV